MIEKAHSKLIEYGTTLNREQRQQLIDELLILFNASNCKHENEQMHQGNGFVYVTCKDCGTDI